jgi:cobalt-zinc-cadmium resistance protein CzcA
MNKIIKNLFAFALKNRFFVFFLTIILIVAGIVSFFKTPIEAFPDVTNTQIIIITQWPGQSAEEMERAVTVPIEIAMSSVQRKTSVRSITMFGLSIVTLIFDDDVEDFYARQQVNSQLVNVDLPQGVNAEVEPPYGPTGEIFRYILQSKTRSSRELLTLQNWVVDPQLRSIEGVADINAFGGEQKIYEIAVNPNELAKYGITPLEVYDAVQKSNLNVGGDVIEKNDQAFVVRGVGLLTSIADIENIIVTQRGGVPVLVKHVAQVQETAAPRVGQVGFNDNDDAVEGIVVMRKNENPSDILRQIKAKVNEINDRHLPPDVKIVPFYDRDDLIRYCTHTVLHNLFEGIILVTAVVFLFMADWRATFIVSIIIPLALLFAFVCMRLKGMSANLLSLGAVDFGIIIDGAVVMVEGLFVVLAHRAQRVGMPAFNVLAKLGLIKNTGAELGKAVFFSKLIIITALLPIFSFEKVEGKMFSPLAYTLGFALLGALLFTLTLVPVMVSLLLNKNVRERRNPFVEFTQHYVLRAFRFTFSRPKASLFGAVVLLVASLASTIWLGSEFLPQLNEGSLWVEAGLPMSTSLTETVKMVHKIRAVLLSFPEVKSVMSQTGRPNDGTDPSGFYYMESEVNLYPKETWKRHITSDELVEEMDRKLKQYPGIDYNYSQPIIDNVEEAVAGFNANQAAKIFGPDLKVLDSLADQTMAAMSNVRGVKDLGVMRNIGQPEISIMLNEEKMAAYGVTTADCQAVVEMAIGGKTVSQMYEGERKFDIRIRYPYAFRKSQEDIGNILVPTLAGGKVPLKQVAEINTETGPAFIYRDANRRFVGVKFTVRERDLGSTIADAQQQVARNVHLPPGYDIAWAGEYENQVRANRRLAHVVPISLILIFILLFIAFGGAKDAGLVLLTVPFALIGGILALHMTRTDFGISAGVGFIALFGICVQNGVILISVFKKNLKSGLKLSQAIEQGVASRVRPVVMTALMAALGLLPAAVSTGIGSESQKPLAIVVIGGLISATFLILLIFPILFNMAYGGENKGGDGSEKSKRLPLLKIYKPPVTDF